MSNISSNSLFHFTSRPEHLISILTNDLYPRYCFENTPLNSVDKRGTLIAGIPMICFCDISLSQIKNHVDTYGHYGIGLTKEWGIQNKLNPVIYVNDASSISISIISLVRQVISKERVTDQEKTIEKELINISYFLKPYQGDFIRSGSKIKNVRFYNEREWRYVPSLLDNSKYRTHLSEEEYNNPITLAQANSKLSELSLKFNHDDIKYIFVKDEKEISAMVKALKDIKNKKFSTEVIEILTSKILTTEQILNDF